MLNVIFKNLKKSDIARDVVTERIEAMIEKFPDLQKGRMSATLEMQNSPQQRGPDLFSVRIQVHSGRYRGLQIRKAAQSLYAALADVVEHLLEILNRHGDRTRIKARNRARKFALKNCLP